MNTPDIDIIRQGSRAFIYSRTMKGYEWMKANVTMVHLDKDGAVAIIQAEMANEFAETAGAQEMEVNIR